MLNYKKPAFWVIVVAVVAFAVVTVCFATNPKQDFPQGQRTVKARISVGIINTFTLSLPQKQYILQARITEVEDCFFLIAPVEGSPALSSCDLLHVPITDMAPSSKPQVGDIVEITYDGFILESYPGQFGTIYSIRVISQKNSLEIEKLRVKYPEYFELGTFKELDVYVWQMAENDYHFALMQGTNHEKTPKGIMTLKGASAEEMALILSTYDIEDKNIFVIPWQNPISSYAKIIKDMTEYSEYINNIRTMLGLDATSH